MLRYTRIDTHTHRGMLPPTTEQCGDDKKENAKSQGVFKRANKNDTLLKDSVAVAVFCDRAARNSF